MSLPPSKEESFSRQGVCMTARCDILATREDLRAPPWHMLLCRSLSRSCAFALAASGGPPFSSNNGRSKARNCSGHAWPEAGSVTMSLCSAGSGLRLFEAGSGGGMTNCDRVGCSTAADSADNLPSSLSSSNHSMGGWQAGQARAQEVREIQASHQLLRNCNSLGPTHAREAVYVCRRMCHTGFSTAMPEKTLRLSQS